MIALLNKPNSNKLFKSLTSIKSKNKFYTTNINNNHNEIKKLIELKNGEIKNQYLINNNNNDNQIISIIKENQINIEYKSNKNLTLFQNLIYKFSSYFLPKGYPTSVSPDYIKYHKWIFLQNVVGSTTYVLSTHALLTTVVGMSVQSALPFAAAISWVLKDGLGAFALVFFANKFSTLFDYDLKRYKFRGDILHNFGVLLEMCTPFIQNYFLPLASISNLSKGIAGLIYGSTRASINMSFSIKDNIGDITAKYQSQSMAAYLSGMGIGSLLGLFFTSTSPISGLSIVFSLSFLHMFLGYKAVKSIELKSLNKQRYSILIDHWLNNNNEILNSKIVNQKEEFIFNSKYYENPIIKLGLSSDDIEGGFINNNQSILKSIQFSILNNNNDYFITIDNNNKQISVYYLDNIENNNNNNNQNIIYLKSFFHSHLIKNELLLNNNNSNNNSSSNINGNNIQIKTNDEILKLTQEIANEKFEFFINDLIKSNQWNISPSTILMMEIGETKFKLN